MNQEGNNMSANQLNKVEVFPGVVYRYVLVH